MGVRLTGWCRKRNEQKPMKNEAMDEKSDMATTLGLGSPIRRRRNLARRLGAGICALALVVFFFKWNGGQRRADLTYKTQPAGRGDLTITVTATGNLEPTNKVEIGSELSGIIDTVCVDYNDRVITGQVLARLDTSRLDAEVLKAKAALAAARAKVLQTETTVFEARNQLNRLQEARKMSHARAVSQQDMDTAQAALDRALAEQAGARAGVDQAVAALNVVETDLSKAAIRSPFDGIVLSRSVEPGQTVAASLQAPVLFTLAEDLSKMELHADVDEADVSQVKEGQEAVFTVDAYPERTFPAKIAQVRHSPKTVEGVVTYETILSVDNSELALRPGMTATADIIVDHIQNALLVPNAAFRFVPPEQETESTEGRGLVSMLFPRPPRVVKKKAETLSENNRRQVWALQKTNLVAIPVTVGRTDGSMTEIKDGDVAPGMELVVGSLSVEK
jgi:HlyD family secretion protein